MSKISEAATALRPKIRKFAPVIIAGTVVVVLVAAAPALFKAQIERNQAEELAATDLDLEPTI